MTPAPRRWLFAGAAAAALALAVFLFYFLVYPLERLTLPVGFDAPWYIWRAELAAQEPIGPLGTAARPGHALLSALLGAMSGLSQVTLAAILPLVLASVFALAIGALGCEGLGGRRSFWAISIVLAGAALGLTRLPGENVANLLNLLLTVGGLAFLCRWVAGNGGIWGAVLTLVAAGLAHWLFLGISLAVLAVAAVLALPSSMADAREGVPVLRTEAGAAMATGAATAGLLAALILVLDAPLRTFEGNQDPRRFLPKLRNDAARLPFLTPVAVTGALLLWRGRREEALGDAKGHVLRAPAPADRARRFVLRVLVAWSAVCLLGLIASALTRALPPHRFLALLVAVPGAIALAAAVAFVHARLRVGRPVAAVITTLAVAALAVPSAVAWYGKGPGQWMNAATLREARAAGQYISTMPPRLPVVFLVSPLGGAGALSAALKERTIRAGLPADLLEDSHFFVGDLPDLLAGRRTVVRNPETNRVTLPYWNDVRPVLRHDPLVVVMRSAAARAFREARNTNGATLLAPGVALLRRSGETPAPVPVRPPPVRLPGVVSAALQALLLLGLMAVAGAGWTLALHAPSGSRGWAPEAVLPLSPVVGSAVLMIVALPLNLARVEFTRAAALAVFLVVAAGGAVLARSVRARGASARRSLERGRQPVSAHGG